MSNTFLEQAKEYLRDSGGRMTAQRRLILETIESFSGHPTAEEIYTRAHRQDTSLNLSTVYRTLHWLEEVELISSRHFDEDRRSERFDPNTPSEHHHFRCHVCGKIIEFDNDLVEQIAEHFEARSGAQVANISLTLYGVCRDCSQARA